MFTFHRLTQVLNKASKKEIPINDKSKIILFSDCHRGDLSWADDFAHNKNIFLHALNHYYKNNFTYIEIGDGDELWKNNNFWEIREAHGDVFQILKNFHEANRFYMLWGNHNIFWKYRRNVRKNLFWYFSERKNKKVSLFRNINVLEALILKYKKNRIFIVHGHQGEIFNDYFWLVYKFLSLFIWKPLQLFGLSDLTSPAKNYTIRHSIEKKIRSWVVRNKQFTVMGHTHRPIFPKNNKPPLFNTGSCVHPHCITGIEIQNGQISLIKWFVNIQDNGTLFIDKEILDGPAKLSSYFQ